MAGLAALQLDAYSAVCRAFYAQEALRWDQEELLTQLRTFWNIDNQQHAVITTSIKTDPDVVAVRNGGMPSRAARKSTGGGGGVPSLEPARLAALPQQPAPEPPPTKRRQAAPLPTHSDLSSPAISDYSDEGTSQQSRQRGRKDGQAAKKGGRPRAGGGGAGGSGAKPRAQQRRSMGGRPMPMGGGAVGAPGGGLQRMTSGLQRSRSTRQNAVFGGAAADPLGFVGRRLWRLWPQESPPWVEGFIQQWDAETDNYTVVYDPNTRESTEELFNFGNAVEGGDYVMGEYVDITNVHGSRRQHDKPYVSPEAMAAPPPPGMLAALVPAPSKKRKSTSGAPVPADAPFEVTYLHARLPIAAEDELQQMLSVLERKERVVEAEINILEYQEANREDIEERGALERRFRELCEREAALMAEMAALRDAAAV